MPKSPLDNPIFKDAAKARAYLEKLLWADGRACGYCGAVDESTELPARPGFYQCNACRKQFTVQVGTVFERSHIPLNKWLLAAFLQMMAIRLGREDLGLGGGGTGMLQAAIAIGIGLGSLAAGRLSGPKVEPGLVPLGSIGMGAASVWLAGATGSLNAALPALAALGFFGGLFIVPLNAALQQKAPVDERGRVVACANMIGTAGILGIKFNVFNRFFSIFHRFNRALQNFFAGAVKFVLDVHV